MVEASFYEFVKSSHCVFRLVMWPVKLFDFNLKGDPIFHNITGEELDRLFDLRGTIEWETRTSLIRRQTEILTFDVSFFHEVCNILSVELPCSRLTRMRHSGPIKASGSWRRRVGAASTADIRIGHSSFVFGVFYLFQSYNVRFVFESKVDLVD